LQYLTRTYDKAQHPFLVTVQKSTLLDSTTPFFVQKEDLRAVYGSR
jgi:hypothetical protein